jgi:LCP family protein required for cell wall assembly
MQGGGSPPDRQGSGPGNRDQATSVPVANEEGLRALGASIDAAQPKASKRRRRVKWTLGIVGIVIVLIVAGVGGYAWYLNHLVHRITVNGLAGGETHGTESGTENILLVGSTDRCALKKQYIGYGICNQGVNGINSDVVMILHLNPTTKTVSILSIPRDLFVPNARVEGANKIDAALFQGPTQLVAAIEEDFGIPVQHYVELNFDSFANVVDALGGINMYFPEPVYDPNSDLDVRTVGCDHLNGFHALQVVRARHLVHKGPGVTSPNPANWTPEAQSDLARIRRDHEFLRVLATAVAKKGLSNPLTDRDIIQGVAPDLTVDNGLSASHMLNLVLTYHSVNVDSAPQLTLPVLEDTFGSYQYKGGSYGDIEFPTQPTDQSVVDQFLGISSATNSMTGTPLPARSQVTVSVANGTGVTNQAATTSAALGALGFHMMELGDTPPVGQEAETVVYYGSKKPAVVAAAQMVARSISGSVTLGYNPSEVLGGAEVTVDTGTSFTVNTPQAATTTPSTTAASPKSTTKSPKSTTTTATKSTKSKNTTTTTVPPPTTTTSPSTAGFAAASSANEALQPWDPRSCTASGGEGP